MKKLLAVILAVVMAFSACALAFAEDAPAADAPAAPAFDLGNIGNSINDIINQIVAALSGDILAKVQEYISKIISAIEGVLPEGNVLGAVADLESALGNLSIGKDLFDYCKNLINTLKQKIKDLYAHETETCVEETEASVPADTGSASIGIACFAAVSVAAAAAYVCTRKKED